MSSFFTREELGQKNNTLFIILTLIILVLAIYILFSRDDLTGVIISLCLVIACGVIAIIMVE